MQQTFTLQKWDQKASESRYGYESVVCRIYISSAKYVYNIDKIKSGHSRRPRKKKTAGMLNAEKSENVFFLLKNSEFNRMEPFSIIFSFFFVSLLLQAFFHFASLFHPFKFAYLPHHSSVLLHHHMKFTI